MASNLNRVVSELTEELTEFSCKKQSYLPEHSNPIPSPKRLAEVVDKLREVLFPGFFEGCRVHQETLKYHVGGSLDQIASTLQNEIHSGLCFNYRPGGDESNRPRCKELSLEITEKFLKSLPEIKALLAKDVTATYNGDPAAKSEGEIIYCYPTIKAVINHRIAHKLMLLGVPMLPRIISEMAHSETGIDIHPGASIGEGFVIDHGTGVVIGETAIIGSNVKLYQGVTLGAKSFPTDDEGNPIKGILRHPIVEDDVTIYAHATILGRITIGEGSIIGGNVSILKSVDPYSRVLQQRHREVMFADGLGI